VNSIDRLVLTHLDVYDALEEFEACIGYHIGSKLTEDFPASIKDLETVRPVLRRFKGWNCAIGNCRTYGELPLSAREYIEFIEEFTETPISIVSVGSDRNQTIVRESPWIK
jgi:adenylosuccinate synthase